MNALREIVEKALAHAPDWEHAAEEVHRELSDDPDLRTRVEREELAPRIWNLIKIVSREKRGRAWRGAPSGEDDARASIEALADCYLSESPMSGGRRVAEACLPEVVHEAEMYEAFAQGNAEKGAWFRAIAECLPDSETPVGKVLDEDSLRELQKSSRGP